ncbi:hypothetical protein FOXG_18148 [Fusarium oxysporum f. sp. lycopersici 4287]|uniref:Uncharacterized protein n=2 Tax=Fusarium oxysporum TaxID=5507 RepID=A0A0J9UC46_FUSO4|nr:hypothetical protein FOXG_18148 [Fusarium oxysporum f. sp. lycopersici 4287]EXK42703.1 hypothetical protein FOMG_05510 [Fusarium oxysporum f. sp. melonis 26406]KNA96412.1 hypothetical protein FOXG_18148 [Fusarium oxysporum f. sp. lycopersici 4287]
MVKTPTSTTYVPGARGNALENNTRTSPLVV